MTTGNKDVDYLIITFLNDKDLFNYRQVNKYTYKISEIKWKLKTIEKFGQIKKINRSWKFFYNIIEHYSKNYSLNNALCKLSKGGLKNFDLIYYLIGKGADNWNWGLYGAIIANDKTLIYYFIKKGANNWKEALKISKETNNIELIKFFKNKN